MFWSYSFYFHTNTHTLTPQPPIVSPPAVMFFIIPPERQQLVLHCGSNPTAGTIWMAALYLPLFERNRDRNTLLRSERDHLGDLCKTQGHSVFISEGWDGVECHFLVLWEKQMSESWLGASSQHHNLQQVCIWLRYCITVAGPHYITTMVMKHVVLQSMISLFFFFFFFVPCTWVEPL